jgi:hypothetical protein
MHRLTLPEGKWEGTGESSVPGAPVPPMQTGDAERQAAIDYAGIHNGDFKTVLGVRKAALAWIRRCVTAEAFARSLETSLEKLRSQKPCP